MKIVSIPKACGDKAAEMNQALLDNIQAMKEANDNGWYGSQKDSNGNWCWLFWECKNGSSPEEEPTQSEIFYPYDL
jgi:hypothetical protein